VNISQPKLRSEKLDDDDDNNNNINKLHFNICKETGVQLDKKQWYEHVPK